MAKTAFNRFIADAERNGLPVRFMREVAHSSYTFQVGGQTQVNPWLNTMTLEQGELDSVANLSASAALKLDQGVLNIYHEATHAWLDLNESKTEVAALEKHGSEYYRAAPLLQGGKTDDSGRIFQEAIASYVGHRVAHMWRAIQVFTQLAGLLTKKSPPPNNDGVVRAARMARADYERAMAQRVFGYQTPGLFDRTQLDTTKGISSRIKTFADRVLLEGKIPDQLDSHPKLKAMWKQLQTSLYPRPRKLAMTRAPKVAIAILVLLVAIQGQASVSPCESAKAQLETLATQLELYRASHGSYPPTEQWIRALKESGLMDRKENVRDPWGRNYEYRLSGDEYDLASLGADGLRGTEDDQIRAEGFRWKACKLKQGC